MDSEYTALRTRVGTPRYCAPEVDDDEFLDCEYTQAVDMWSLGCVIYTMLVHEPPFPTKRSINKPFQEERLKEHSSEDAVGLIRTLLVRDPTQRATAKGALSCTWLQNLNGCDLEVDHRPIVSAREKNEEFETESTTTLPIRDYKEMFAQPNLNFEIVEQRDQSEDHVSLKASAKQAKSEIGPTSHERPLDDSKVLLKKRRSVSEGAQKFYDAVETPETHMLHSKSETLPSTLASIANSIARNAIILEKVSTAEELDDEPTHRAQEPATMSIFKGITPKGVVDEHPVFDLSRLQDLEVGEGGEILDSEGNQVGQFDDDDYGDLLDKVLYENGDIQDEKGNVVGHANVFTVDKNPTVDLSMLKGLVVGAGGKIFDSRGAQVGQPNEGYSEDLIGKAINKERKILEEDGTVIGLANVPPERIESSVNEEGQTLPLDERWGREELNKRIKSYYAPANDQARKLRDALLHPAGQRAVAICDCGQTDAKFLKFQEGEEIEILGGYDDVSMEWLLGKTLHQTGIFHPFYVKDASYWWH